MKKRANPSRRRIPRSRFTDLGQLPIAVRLGTYNAQALYWGFFEPKWWRNFMHAHSFFEVCYVYSGRGIFRIMGKEYPVNAGNVFVAKPGEPHEIVSDRRNPLGIYFWAYTLTRGKFTGSELSPIDELLDVFVRSSRWLVRARSMRRTLELLTEEVAQRLPGFPTVIDGLVTKLVLDTARAVVEKPIFAEQLAPPQGSGHQAVVRNAFRYIHDNFSRPIGVRDIAAQVHVSERHLGRLFLQIQEVTVMEFVTRVRLEAAQQLLLDSQSVVKQVATAVGYPDVHYFTTLFHKRTGVTPGVFRKDRGTVFANPKRRFSKNGP